MEIKSETTGNPVEARISSDNNSSSGISFKPPFHEMCVEKHATVYHANGVQDYIDLEQLGLEFMPEVIIIDEKEYRYAGVQDGRGVYRESIEIEEKTRPAIKDDHTSWLIIDDPVREPEVELVDWENQSEYIKEFVAKLGALYKAGQEVKRSYTYRTITDLPVSVDLTDIQHLLLDLSMKLDEMKSNPPGIEGIVLNGEAGLYGRHANSKIDAGWLAAVKMLRSYIEARLCQNAKSDTATPQDGNEA